LQRLWNPRTQKGLLSAFRGARPTQLVSDALEHGEQFFGNLEARCEELLSAHRPARSFEREGRDVARRSWGEVRVRKPEICEDTVSLPLIRLREALSELIKLSDDSESGQELLDCNRRLIEVQAQVAEFLKQSADDHVYWVERGGRSQQLITMNAAPVDVAP